MGFRNCPYSDCVECNNDLNPCEGKIHRYGICITKIENEYPEIYKAIKIAEEAESSSKTEHSGLYYIILYIVGGVIGVALAVVLSALLL